MAHYSLYRVYRPETFDAVIGQTAITDALKEQVASGTIAHAYLFAGSRGLGKTSIARILARELGTSEKDMYEIDAASHNSVDHIRALTEGVYTMPFDSPYKVYLLDEAHMLSKSAWNALLKTLEEPPAHVVFILATTELDRIPDTVESRCQTYTFKKPSSADSELLIKHVATAEKREIDPGATALIALLAEGSYRDTLSILGKVLGAIPAGPVHREAVEQITGAPRHELVAGFVHGLGTNNAQESLTNLSALVAAGSDVRTFSTLVLKEVREQLLQRYAPDLATKSERSEVLPNITERTLATLLDAHERLGFSPVPELALELAVYELCASTSGK